MSPQPGDYITVYWDENSVDEQVVGNVLSDTFPIVIMVTSELALGPHSVYYTAENSAQNLGVSKRVNVAFTNSEPEIKYPASVLFDAVNGVISINSISANNGTHIHVDPNADIQQNDTITLYWRGVSSAGDIVNGDIYSQTVLAGHITASCSFLVPIDKLNAIGDKGTITATYQVRRNGIIEGISRFGQATLDLSEADEKSLILCLSTGAALTDYSAIHLHPFNQGAVKGAPGMYVEMSITGSAVFSDSGTAVANVTLNQDGLAYFKISATAIGGIIVNAQQTGIPAVKTDPVSANFKNYTKGAGKLLYVNSTAGAPANGKTPCSIYVKTDEKSGSGKIQTEITRMWVYILNGNAVIQGYPGENPADIQLNDDKSVEIK